MAWDREKERKAGKTMAVGSQVFGLVFSIFWCVAAASMGAWFMLVFGVPFAGMMAYRLYVCLQYAKSDKQKAEKQDIEPWNRPVPTGGSAPRAGKYCPYCGGSVQEDHAFCPHCGRRQG